MAELESRPPEDELAYHEAGHTIMSLILNSPMIWVTLDKYGPPESQMNPGDDFRALEDRAVKGSYLNEEEIKTLLIYIKVIYAGPMAHGIYRKEQDWHLYLTDGNDDRQAYEILKGIYKNDTEINKVKIELKTWVMEELPREENWNKIVIIAEQLQIDRWLDYKQCTDLLNKNKYS